MADAVPPDGFDAIAPMPETPIKTSKRVFEIFEAFEIAQGPMALKDFTERFGYPPPRVPRHYSRAW
ncbi:hypothetical protein LMG23992_01869 [Cupriavidus laharis]|uniref:Uncharacterized protein n=1 Tax=Cupriavidus laharis TaxID=151654 RepID=A0ABM8WTT8_9BURK|nr:hypothetical protein LMG23992_01869 [Cupriavidus laharis]